MVVLLFLVPPVFVELVDFYSGIPLLNQIKSLHGTAQKAVSFFVCFFFASPQNTFSSNNVNDLPCKLH